MFLDDLERGFGAASVSLMYAYVAASSHSSFLSNLLESNGLVKYFLVKMDWGELGSHLSPMIRLPHGRRSAACSAPKMCPERHSDLLRENLCSIRQVSPASFTKVFSINQSQHVAQ